MRKSLSVPFPGVVLAAVPWFLCSLSGAGGSASAGPSSSPVVGGRAVEFGDWPDVVAILTHDGGLCSGTLLGADLVVTAGHCVDAGPREVIVGSIDLARPDGQRRAVKWARAYPNWADTYDVGVIMLENPVFARQRAIAQGCTPARRMATGTRLELVGFGLATRAATDENTRLHAATIEVVDAACTEDPSCARAVAPYGEFTAGGNGTDACFGDSGGPVYIPTAHGPALVGIVSRGLATFGDPCGDGGVFVRADKVVAWIQSVSGRRIDRVSCDVPADDAGGGDEPPSADAAGGCSAAGTGTGGLVQAGLATLYALAYIAAIRRSRRRPRWRRDRGTP